MYCKVYKIKMNGPRTCIARQSALAKYHGKPMQPGYGVTPAMKYHGCKGCKKGLKIYKKFLEEGVKNG